MNLNYPYQFDPRGRTAEDDDDTHVRDLIEQVLLTSPGERVNRPDFGSGLYQLVFAPNSPEVAAAIQLTAQAALQRWLGRIIDVQELSVSAEDSTLRVVVGYTIKRTQSRRVAQFSSSAAGNNGGGAP